MAILIFAGLGVLVWGLFNISIKDASTAAVDQRPEEFGTRSLGLPAGCDIVDASAAGDRLIVRTSCNQVRIIDLKTGAALGTVTP